ncbi:MAG TPA: DUF2382 domain-containing protein [Gemmatimonadaceae bacterium]
MAKQTRTNVNEPGGLIPLSDAKGWHVREGDPHVQGWDVLASNGTDIGDVDDLLVDLQAQKARYLIVELNDNVPGADGRKVAIPLGTAQLDEHDDSVRLPGMTAQQLAGFPEYQRDRFSRQTENTILQGMGGAPSRTTGPEFYNNALFDENRFYGARRPGGAQEQRIPLAEEELAVGKRTVQAGEVDIHKSVETEHVEREVPVMREEVDVERRPISAERGAQAGAADIGEQEIRVPLMEEEVVVEKRPVVKEELIVKKHAVEGTQEVEADVRKERVDIDKQGNVRANFEGGAERDRNRRPPNP